MCFNIVHFSPTKKLSKNIESAYSWVGDSLLQAVASPFPPYIEDQCEELTYRKYYIGQVSNIKEFNIFSLLRIPFLSLLGRIPD